MYSYLYHVFLFYTIMNFRSTTRQNTPTVFKKKQTIVNFEDTKLFPALTPSAIASGVQSLPGAFGYGSLQIHDTNTNTNTVKTHYDDKSDLDFLQASMKEVPKEEIVDKKWELKPGWVQITVDDNNRIITRKHDDDVEYIQSDSEIFEEEMQQTLEILINNWDNYRRNYIESYGEDDYEKYYMFKYE